MSIHQESLTSRGETLLEKTIRSDLAAKTPLILRFSSLLIENQLIEESNREKIEVCLEEALKNCIVHGNNLEPQLTVDARLFQTDQEWGVEFTDQGGGFSDQEIPDPEGPDFPWREDGRGIHIMRHIADDVQFFDGGRTIVLTWQI